jgi:lipopolysaccharide biosynthesis glycosyltransferase
MQSKNSQEVIAATAADEGYAIPLAVTVRSAIDALPSDRRLRLFVLDGGITSKSRDRLMRSWEDPRVRIEWIKPDISVVNHLPVSLHVSVSCYLRLLLPELLPSDVGKLIYFDSDMLIRRDLGELFAEPLGDKLALAVQEMAAPWMDAELAADGYASRVRYLAATRPVPNYQDLGIPPEAPYFNSGLLVFDAAKWRAQEMAKKVFDCLETHSDHVLWWDQYALNVELAGQWRPLDVRWNQTAWAFEYPSWRESPLSREQFQQIRSDPWIVHFCSPTKPWHYFCDHPYRQAFFSTLKRTEWRDWRPQKSADAGSSRWKYLRRKFRKTIRSFAATAKEHRDGRAPADKPRRGLPSGAGQVAEQTAIVAAVSRVRF